MLLNVGLMFCCFFFNGIRHNSSLICMVGLTYVYIDMILAFYGYIFLCPSLLLSWMFEHDCLDTCCVGCLICMCFEFLYLHLFSAIEHVLHGKVL